MFKILPEINEFKVYLKPYSLDFRKKTLFVFVKPYIFAVAP
jgi:hypothetical protein